MHACMYMITTCTQLVKPDNCAIMLIFREHTHTHIQWHSVRNYPCDTSNSPGQLRPAFQMFNRKGVYSGRLFPQVHLERIRSREYRNIRQRNRKMTQLFIILHNGLGTAVEIIFSHMNHNGKGERIAECKLLFAQPTCNSQLKHKVRKLNIFLLR